MVYKTNAITEFRNFYKAHIIKGDIKIQQLQVDDYFTLPSGSLFCSFLRHFFRAIVRDRTDMKIVFQMFIIHTNIIEMKRFFECTNFRKVLSM